MPTGAKGQIFTFDLCISFIGIIVILVAFFANSALIALHTAREYRDFADKEKMLTASEMLMATTGGALDGTRDWKYDFSSSIGLAFSSQNTVQHHLLSRSKVDELKSMNASDVAAKLGLGGYGFGISIDGDDVTSSGSIANAGAFRRAALCYAESQDQKVCILEIRLRFHG